MTKFRAATTLKNTVIEEPEIYQHPHKQKLVSAAFRYICVNGVWAPRFLGLKFLRCDPCC